MVFAQIVITRTKTKHNQNTFTGCLQCINHFSSIKEQTNFKKFTGQAVDFIHFLTASFLFFHLFSLFGVQLAEPLYRSATKRLHRMEARDC